MSNGKKLTKRRIKKKNNDCFWMENIFCLESHIHLCSRHTSSIPAYVIKTCVTWHAISGTRYWGFVSPKLHVSTYRNQQHCWWFHKKYRNKLNKLIHLAEQHYYEASAFEKRSPGRQMRPINATGDPEPHHRWSGWRLVNSPKFRCWHSSSIVFKLFIGCPNQNYYKIMYTHYLSSWIYKYK